jgi:hypothetical protein
VRSVAEGERVEVQTIPAVKVSLIASANIRGIMPGRARGTPGRGHRSGACVPSTRPTCTGNQVRAATPSSSRRGGARRATSDRATRDDGRRVRGQGEPPVLVLDHRSRPVRGARRAPPWVGSARPRGMASSPTLQSRATAVETSVVRVGRVSRLFAARRTRPVAHGVTQVSVEQCPSARAFLPSGPSGCPHDGVASRLPHSGA